MIDQDNPVIEFTAQDRCDGCGGQAYHLADHSDFGELMFCNHHMRPVYDRMIREGWTIVSDTLAIEAISGNNHSYPTPV